CSPHRRCGTGGSNTSCRPGGRLYRRRSGAGMSTGLGDRWIGSAYAAHRDGSTGFVSLCSLWTVGYAGTLGALAWNSISTSPLRSVTTLSLRLMSPDWVGLSVMVST